ncbi:MULTISPECIES: LLM class flavin-dependent oxidoreductase [unclassified Paenibacillus]|uniref:LLM class flavin-dependent oxidoreductase n=1 Tax=unclassified Paenibacillus TaxID=185978 RepID=UPI000FE27A49|nr:MULTISPECIES: LLM class flavin-dependent oxidoreductase [unclassified Paenibacillus]MCM3172956.1 LLM class flavin-dependent oxidoreductase [Paenibacillus sp. MER 99-2]
MSFTLGILDQSIVFPGQTAAEALNNTVELVKLAESLGYDRFWVAEHHDSEGVAGSSPEVLVSYLLAQTRTIRIGSGGVMLQHYSPYKVAENFNVLATLAPGRVELGIGRAPGGLPRSTKALQKGIAEPETLEEKLVELQDFLHSSAGEHHAQPGLSAHPLPVNPAGIYMLGTSVSSAELAARQGLPYVFALFINSDPETARAALDTYRDLFNREQHGEPQATLALSVIAADTEEEAAELAGQHKSVRVTLASGKTVNVQTLEQAEEFARQAGESYTAVEREADITRGTKETVRERLLELSEEYGVDSFVFTTIVPDFNKRVRSFQLLKEAFTEELV